MYHIAHSSATSLSNNSDIKLDTFTSSVPCLLRVKIRIVEDMLISKEHTQGSQKQKMHYPVKITRSSFTDYSAKY